MLGKCSGEEGEREGGSAERDQSRQAAAAAFARALSPPEATAATAAAAFAVTKDSFVSATDSGYLRIQTIPFTIDGSMSCDENYGSKRPSA